MTNVHIVDAAMSDRIGTANLEIHPGNTLPKLDTGADTGFQQGLQPIAQIEVPVSTLDAQLDIWEPPAFVKMDIEGAEAAALRGAEMLMMEIRPVLICEPHGTNEAVMDQLDSYGYVATTVGQPGTAPREADWKAYIVAT
jgi:FkbM family methyltransferase